MSTPLDIYALPLQGRALIEASAGTGKTWTLGGLYLRLLLEQERKVRDILVVTFTKAATAELKSRIRERLVAMEQVLREPASADPAGFEARYATRCMDHEEWRERALSRLRLAISEFDEAAIFTIHGFCQRALAEVPFAAGLAFGMEVVEDDKRLIDRVAADFYRHCLRSGELNPQQLLALRAQLSPEALAKLMHKRLGQPLTVVEFAGGGVPADFETYCTAYATARELWHAQRTTILDVMLEGLGGLKGQSYKPERVRESAREWDAFFTLPLAPPPAVCAKESKRKYLCAGHMQAQRKANGKVPQHAFFERCQVLQDCAEAAQAGLNALVLSLLQRFLNDYPDRIRQARRERRVLAYDDMLFNLHACLHDPTRVWLAAALRRRYPVALIDEFQDTDPLQLQIFSTIYPDQAESTLILVGDPKQAIYGFRNADLYAYMQARQLSGEQLWSLGQNQRSVPALLAGINALFGHNPQAFALPKIAYVPLQAGTRAQQRVPLTDERWGGPPLKVWWLPQAEDGGLLSAGAAEALAEQATVAEVVRLLQDASAGRVRVGTVPLQPGQIAVIVRTHAQGARVKLALHALGVHAVERTQQSIFATDEAQVLGLLLTALDEPANDAMLRAVLISDLYGVVADELVTDSVVPPRVLQATLQFARYRELWQRHGWARAWRQVLRDGGLMGRIRVRADGERRLTNFMHLSELIQNAWSGLHTVNGVRRWLLDALSDSSVADEHQLRLESDAEHVQIVTVHAAKGLEYGVVFCPFLWRGLQGLPDGGEGVSYHRADGTAVVRYGVIDVAIAARATEEAFAEQLRLIYVAATRAVQRLYLVAGVYAHSKDAGAASRVAPLHWLIAGSGHNFSAWLQGRGPELAELHRQWTGWADQHADAVVLQALPQEPAQRYEAADNESGLEVAEAMTRRVQPAWRSWSFTALARPYDHVVTSTEDSAADYDAGVMLPLDAPGQPAVTAADDILNFPRGSAAGVLLHAAFELADFTDSRTWGPAIERALLQAPLAGEDERLVTAMLHRALMEATQADLSGQGLQLRDVHLGDRISELEFTLAADDSSGTNGMLAILRAAGIALPALQPGSVGGFLRGAIDCLIRHGGRFFLIDWKSNYLGSQKQDYARPALERVMVENSYHLQYHLYTLALHRYLRSRMPDFDYDTHFGGCFYLFVRGMRGDWLLQSPGSGIYFARPDSRTVAALDDLLRGDGK